MEELHRFVVTIDGAAGTGKSTVAQELARRLGTDCLDTGAMYRAVAPLAIENDIDLKRWLFGFGNGIRIESPPILREQHQQHASSITEMYTAD